MSRTVDSRELKSYYEHHTHVPLPPAAARLIAYRSRVFARRVGRPPLRILEIGAGHGDLLGILAARGHRVSAADLSTERLRALPAAGGRIAKTTADATQLPFASGALDVVVAAEVLEHLPDYRAAIAEIARVLRPGGVFLVSVPFEETLQEILCPKCLERFPLNGHLHSFREAGFAEDLRRAGFRPGRAHVGPSFPSREIWKRLPIPGVFTATILLDSILHGSLRASDSWMLFSAAKT